MRRLWRTGALLVFCLGISQAAQQAPLGAQRLDLEKVVELALVNSENILSLKEELSIAEQRVRASTYLFFPKIDFNASATKYNALRSVVLPPEFGSVILLPSQKENLYTGRASLRQPLYAGGKSHYAHKLATAQLDQSRSQLDQTLHSVRMAATIGYYDLLLAQQLQEEAQAKEKFLDSLRRRREGLGLLERIRLESETAGWRKSLQLLVKDWEIQKLKFLDTINLELTTPFVLEGTLEELEGFAERDLSLAKALAWAEEYRPEFRYEQNQAKMDILAVELALADRYPTVNFEAIYEFAGQEFPLRDTTWGTGIDFNLPISLSNWTKIRQRRSEQRQGYLKRVQLEDQIRLEVREAYQELVYWSQEKEKRVEEYQRLAALAKTFLAGSQPLLQQCEVHKRLMDSRQEYWTALHHFLVSKAKMEHATGRKFNEK